MPAVFSAATAHGHHSTNDPGKPIPDAKTNGGDLRDVALDSAIDIEQNVSSDDNAGYNDNEDYLYLFPPERKRKGDLSLGVLMSGLVTNGFAVLISIFDCYFNSVNGRNVEWCIQTRF